MLKVLEHVNIEQVKQKTQYEKKKSSGVRVFNLKTGDRVLKKNMKNIDRKGGKMKAKWLGPYT